MGPATVISISKPPFYSRFKFLFRCVIYILATKRYLLPSSVLVGGYYSRWTCLVLSSSENHQVEMCFFGPPFPFSTLRKLLDLIPSLSSNFLLFRRDPTQSHVHQPWEHRALESCEFCTQRAMLWMGPHEPLAISSLSHCCGLGVATVIVPQVPGFCVPLASNYQSPRGNLEMQVIADTDRPKTNWKLCRCQLQPNQINNS